MCLGPACARHIMPLSVVQCSWFLSPFDSQGACRREWGGTCLRSHSQCLSEVSLKAALGCFSYTTQAGRVLALQLLALPRSSRS